MKELIYLLIFGAGVGVVYFIYMSFEQKRAAKRKLGALKLKENHKQLVKDLETIKQFEKKYKGDQSEINKKIREYNAKYGTNYPTYGDD